MKFLSSLKVSLTVGFIGIAMIFIIINEPTVVTSPLDKTCLVIEETRIVKMMGHLNWDQCYVVSVDADENTELHTIQCVDTLKFK